MKGLAFCLWPATAWFLGCGMGTLNFSYGFASIISAVMGAILLMYASRVLNLRGGEHTLSLLCAHSIVFNYYYYFGNPLDDYLISETYIYTYANLLLHLVWAILGVYFLKKIPWINKYIA